jgi:glutamate dehydrogenase (NAD(P)+)
VQGLGNVGYHAAKFLIEGGAVMVGVAEYEGAIYNPDGIDLEGMVKHREDAGKIFDFGDSENVGSSQKIFEYDCDILIPAALENQITKENAPNIKAKIIGEAANGPTTADASKILHEMGVLIVPDLYLNAGGVTVSYFEWLKNLSHVRFGRMQKRFEETTYRNLLSAVENLVGKEFSEVDKKRVAHGPNEHDLVNSGLEETMIGAYHEIQETRRKQDSTMDLRTATYLTAINKIGDHYLRMGIFP